MKKSKHKPAPEENSKHGPLFEKNVRFHYKDGTTSLTTYSKCKDKPIDVKLYSGESKFAS